MKRYPFAILLLIIILYSQTGSSQNVIIFGPEIGLSASRLPHFESNSYPDVNSNLNITKRENPLASPIIGFTGQLTTVKHVQLTAGLSYQMTGVRNSGHTESVSPAETYNSLWTEKQTFHKLSIPLTTGLSFRIKENLSSVYVGFKPNLFLTGKYDYQWENHTSLPPYEETETIEYNPLNPDQAVIPAKMVLGQFLCGVSNTIATRFKISLYACIGGRNYFNQSTPPPDILAYRNFKYLVNNDFGVSVTYLINAFKKHEQKRNFDTNERIPVIAQMIR